MVSQSEQRRQLRRIWNEVVTDHPLKDEEFCRTRCLNIYNTSYNDCATLSDLDEALETIGDAHR